MCFAFCPVLCHFCCEPFCLSYLSLCQCVAMPAKKERKKRKKKEAIAGWPVLGLKCTVIRIWTTHGHPRGHINSSTAALSHLALGCLAWTACILFFATCSFPVQCCHNLSYAFWWNAKWTLQISAAVSVLFVMVLLCQSSCGVFWCFGLFVFNGIHLPVASYALSIEMYLSLYKYGARYFLKPFTGPRGQWISSFTGPQFSQVLQKEWASSEGEQCVWVDHFTSAVTALHSVNY